MRSVNQLAGAVLVVPMLAMAGTAAGQEDAVDGKPAATDLVPRTELVSTVTLITGDVIVVDRRAGGQPAVTVDPTARRGGAEPAFETSGDGGHVYVIPSDAAPLIPDVLDRELFNVTKLAEYGYHDGVPVIIAGEQAAQAASAGATPGVTGGTPLPSIDAVAATIEGGGAWWDVVHPPGPGGDARASGGPAAGLEQVWLDELVEVALDESVPQIGAPTAWDAGYDGTGVTVAILDTGIDEDHPDLAGKVAGSANFTTEPDTSDGHGHGTHVSGIVASSGAAVDSYVGVAPGAELLMGKVCDAAGSCPTSGIIAGMEWAAPRADVINMSVGTSTGSDGTDPLSQAVNTLTEAHDTLFVISAGNAGLQGDGSVGAPGAADAALTVGSVSKTDVLAATSSRGPRLGDSAIKPDLTAPGVDIVSARAEGTSMPGAVHVGDHHTQVSGTSMAAPHAAGAAAILLQRDPSLSAAGLKAALATTAVPHGDLDVYQQGGGRIDVPAALHAPVRATPAPLDLGFFAFPHDDAEPVSAEVTYTNRTDQPITLGLSLDVASRDGQVPSEAMLSVAPATLTIAAGGSATATVTVDVGEGEIGLYGGYLVAEAGGEPVLRTPVGFHKESETYQLTVVGVQRDGRPAAGGSSFDVLDAHDIDAFRESSVGFVDGTARMRVPPGSYLVMGVIANRVLEGNLSTDLVLAGDPEVEVTGDTTVVLDGGAGVPITFDTPAHDDAAPRDRVSFGFWRGGQVAGTWFHTWTGGSPRRSAVPSDQVTVGEFEMINRWRLGLPELALEVTEPAEQALDPGLMFGSPIVDDDARHPLVDVGLGRPQDYDGVDADGAVVLARRQPGSFTFTSQVTAAAAAGAVAVLVANDIPGQYFGFTGSGAIPSMTLPMEEGDALQALLEDGPVTLRLRGHPVTPFLYNLHLPQPGRVPDDLHFVADLDELATVVNDFHSDIADYEMNEVRHAWRPWGPGISTATRLAVPQRRTEYIKPDDDTLYQQVLYAQPSFNAEIGEPITRYQPGERRDQTWWRQLTRPSAAGGDLLTSGRAATREGDTLTLDVPEWVDDRGNRGWADDAVDTTAFRLYRDGELVAQAARPQGSFGLSPDPAEYRLELDVARDAPWWTTSTATRTAWTVHSERPASGREALPLLVVDYDADVDLSNTAPRPRDRQGPATVGLRVRHQPGADGPPIAGARAWISYDDGDTWQSRPVHRLADGHYEAVLPSRDPVDTSGFLSLRVEAWDTDGNRIEQQITRAWALAPR